MELTNKQLAEIESKSVFEIISGQAHLSEEIRVKAAIKQTGQLLKTLRNWKSEITDNKK